jgi:hypothetical protein
MTETSEARAADQTEPAAEAEDGGVPTVEAEEEPVAEVQAGEEPAAEVEAEERPAAAVEAEEEPAAEATPEPDTAAVAVAEEAPTRVARVYLCERGHRTVTIWSTPTTCRARPLRSGPECGRQLYSIGELPEQVRRALNPLKASKKGSKK